MRRLLKEFSLEEVVLRFEQVSNTSMSTIHRQVIDAEMVVLAKMRRELTRCGLSLRELKEVRVDSCLIQAPKRNAEKVMQTMRDLTYNDLNTTKSPGLERYFKKVVVKEEMPQDERGKARVFRAEVIQDDAVTILQGAHKLPTINADPPIPCQSWTYMDKEEARRRVMEDGQSVYISGGEELLHEGAGEGTARGGA